jgi:hypothetical protein
MLYENIMVSHEEQAYFFPCISFSSFLFLIKKAVPEYSPAGYLNSPLARVGHMSVTNSVIVVCNECTVTAFDLS